MQRRGSEYPPPKAGSRYQRTYNLQNSFTTRIGRTGDLWWWEVNVTAIDPTGFHYTKKVIGNEQILMHTETGWKKFPELAKESKFEFEMLMKEAFFKWAGG